MYSTASTFLYRILFVFLLVDVRAHYKTNPAQNRAQGSIRSRFSRFVWLHYFLTFSLQSPLQGWSFVASRFCDPELVLQLCSQVLLYQCTSFLFLCFYTHKHMHTHTHTHTHTLTDPRNQLIVLSISVVVDRLKCVCVCCFGCGSALFEFVMRECTGTVSPLLWKQLSLPP